VQVDNYTIAQVLYQELVFLHLVEIFMENLNYMELNNMKKIINTPEGIIKVDLTSEEIAQREQDAIQAQAEQQTYETAKAQKEADALAGNNKLLELGLTQAQVTAMTGYTPPAN
jgi:hypothetical protein